MKSKLFVYCKDCGDFDKEVKVKKDIYKFCPMCAGPLSGIKIPMNEYLKNKDEIETIGINMWYGIEDMFKI